MTFRDREKTRILEKNIFSLKKDNYILLFCIDEKNDLTTFGAFYRLSALSHFLFLSKLYIIKSVCNWGHPSFKWEKKCWLYKKKSLNHDKRGLLLCSQSNPTPTPYGNFWIRHCLCIILFNFKHWYLQSDWFYLWMLMISDAC